MRFVAACIFFCFLSCSSDVSLIDAPEAGDIYIFEEMEYYYPVMVDSVSNEIIFCVNNKYMFADAIPEIKDLPKEDFDFTFYLIYEKEEINDLYETGNIIEVYRP